MGYLYESYYGDPYSYRFMQNIHALFAIKLKITWFLVFLTPYKIYEVLGANKLLLLGLKL